MKLAFYAFIYMFLEQFVGLKSSPVRVTYSLQKLVYRTDQFLTNLIVYSCYFMHLSKCDHQLIVLLSGEKSQFTCLQKGCRFQGGNMFQWAET